jgi:hypothetical protein
MSVLPSAHDSSIQNAARRVIRARGPGVLRWGVRLVIAAVALVVLYVVAMNVFIRTRLFRNAIDFDPNAFTIEYTNAYSLLPSRIHVDGLTIRGRDSSVEWILEIDHADFRVSILELLHHRFAAHHVRGDGLSLRVRLYVDSKDVTPELMDELPPVPGFSDPPLNPEGERPTLTDAQYNLWSVDLEDVDAANVREIWIQSMRLAGDMHVHGRWFFRPERWLEAGPAHVDAHRLEATMGKRALASGVDTSLDVTVVPFDVREPVGFEILKYVTIDGGVSGELATANVIGLAKIEGVKIGADRRDPFKARIRMEEGFLRHGTHVEAGTHLRTKIGPTEVTGDVKADVFAETHERDGAVDLSGTTLALDDVATEEEPKTRDWWARVTLHEATLSDAREPRFHAFIDATARDAMPAVAIVAGNTGVPEWLAKVFAMHNLHAHAELRTAPGALDLLGAEAKGDGSASLRADYVKRFGMTNGAVVAELGPLAVGVKLGDESGLVLLGASSWFDRESAWLHVRATR